MAYIPILDSEVDAESPITESLMTRLRDNALAFAQESYTELTGSGNYTVPADVSELKIVLVGGGGGGSGGNTADGGSGGNSGCVRMSYVSTSGGSSLAYSCGAGGAGGVNVAGTVGGDTTFDTTHIARGGLGGSLGSALDPITGVKTSTFSIIGGDGANAAPVNGNDGHSHPAVVAGVPGDGGTAGAGNGGGGGGAPMGFPFYIKPSSLGNGGAGGNHSANGANATTYGAGGGGGGENNTTGGNGSAGIIFVLPVG